MNKTNEVETPPQILDFLVVSCAGRQFAVRTTEIHEVTRVGTLISVRAARNVIEGVINLRGQIIPVIDLAGRIGDISSTPLDQRRLLIIDADGDALGVMVDAVHPDLRSVSPRELRATDEGLATGSRGHAASTTPTWIIATLGSGESYAQVIDTDRILSIDEQRLIAQIREAY